MLPSMWSKNLIIVKDNPRIITASSLNYRFYSKPGQIQELDAQLQYAIQFKRRFKKDYQIILAADLNRSPLQAQRLATSLNLRIFQHSS